MMKVENMVLYLNIFKMMMMIKKKRKEYERKEGGLGRQKIIGGRDNIVC